MAKKDVPTVTKSTWYLPATSISMDFIIIYYSRSNYLEKLRLVRHFFAKKLLLGHSWKFTFDGHRRMPAVPGQAVYIPRLGFSLQDALTL